MVLRTRPIHRHRLAGAAGRLVLVYTAVSFFRHAHSKRLFGALGFLVFSSAIIALGESNRRGYVARSRLAAIVQSSDDAIISKDLDGVVATWNKGAERVFGYTAEEAVGQHITLIIPPDRRSEEVMILDKLRKGERIEHFETIRLHKNGTSLDISVTISPAKDAAGRVVGASKVARDITPQKQIERAMRDSEERFRSIVETTPECVKRKRQDRPRRVHYERRIHCDTLSTAESS
jgi:PAS domain S-box-containing protein